MRTGRQWQAVLGAALVGLSFSVNAAIVNPAGHLSHSVTVQPIIVSNDDGSNTAGYFGDASQQLLIEGFIDAIWAQAGIDVTFLAPNTFNSTFANVGTSDPRPPGDISAVVNAGASAGVLHPDPNILNMFLVNLPAGFGTPLGPNQAAGLGFVNGNGITQFVGVNLLTFTNGQDVVAGVVAHEIGHNLGLDHLVEAGNLMQAAGAVSPGEQLNSAQIAAALASPFSVAIVAVPLPGAVWLLGSGVVAVRIFRRRRRAA